MIGDLHERVRIVLVGTSHPGNIGGAARAMKSMCLTQLYLVQPGQFPHADATAMAAGADDVLSGARVCVSLEEALSGCGTAIATTARTRSIPWPCSSPRAAAAEILKQAQRGPVALVFGRERSGLTNEEIDLCHRVVRIPANPEFSSLKPRPGRGESWPMSC